MSDSSVHTTSWACHPPGWSLGMLGYGWGCVGGGGGTISLSVLFWGYFLNDWTLGAAAHPSKKLAMSVRHHTKVLVDGEG